MMNESEKLDLFLSNIYIYKDDVYRIIMNVFGDEFVAEDLTQKVMANAWRSIHTLKDIKKSKAWVNAITRNVIRGHMRKKSVYITVEDIEIVHDIELKSDLQQLEQDVLDIIISQEDSSMVRKALESIDSTYQMIIRNHVIGEISLKDIASLYGMDYGNVRVMYVRGIKALKAAFKELEKGGKLNG